MTYCCSHKNVTRAIYFCSSIRVDFIWIYQRNSFYPFFHFLLYHMHGFIVCVFFFKFVVIFLMMLFIKHQNPVVKEPAFNARSTVEIWLLWQQWNEVIWIVVSEICSLIAL